VVEVQSFPATAAREALVGFMAEEEEEEEAATKTETAAQAETVETEL
jgi:hypothetical protein